MTWRLIPPREWSSFLRNFANEHQAWLVATELTDGSVRARDAPPLVPLRDLHLVRDGDGRRAIVTVGDEPRRELVIEDPTKISVDETPDGAHGGLSIEGRHSGVRLRFRVAIPADMVDGWLG